MKDFPQGTTHIEELSGELWARLETMAMDGHAVSFGQNYSHDGKFLGGDVTHYLTCVRCQPEKVVTAKQKERRDGRDKEVSSEGQFRLRS